MTTEMIENDKLDVLALEYLPLEEKHRLPDHPCVYFALSISDEVLYIGKAKSLRSRWQGHHRFEQLKRFKSVRIAWANVEEKDLDSFEGYCIRLLNPPLNNSRSGDDPIINEIATIAPEGFFKRRYPNDCPNCRLMGMLNLQDIYVCSSHGTDVFVSVSAKGRVLVGGYSLSLTDPQETHRLTLRIEDIRR
jgi:hypothetical protein